MERFSVRQNRRDEPASVTYSIPVVPDTEGTLLRYQQNLSRLAKIRDTIYFYQHFSGHYVHKSYKRETIFRNLRRLDISRCIHPPYEECCRRVYLVPYHIQVPNVQTMTKTAN